MSAQQPPSTPRLQLCVAQFRFSARLETQAAPLSSTLLARMLPLERSVLHARWSGEAAWVRLGAGLELDPENATMYPHPGQLLLYAGKLSEPELLIPYGACAFASRAGPLAGNPVATVEGDLSQLRALGELLLWKGAQTLKLQLM